MLEKRLERIKDCDKIPPRTRSIYQIGLEGSQNNIAFIVMFNGYNATKAIQDTINVQQFERLKGLLSKVPEDFTWHDAYRVVASLIEHNQFVYLEDVLASI